MVASEKVDPSKGYKGMEPKCVKCGASVDPFVHRVRHGYCTACHEADAKKKSSKLTAALEAIQKLAVTFQDYKKEHPGTKKKPTDEMFTDPDNLNEGDVFARKSKDGEEHYARVIHKQPGERGFMYHRSDKEGNPLPREDYDSPRNHLMHSNMLLGDKVKKVGNKPLEKVPFTHQGKDYSYNKTGDEGIDAAMAHHDNRWKLFSEHATPRQKGVYSRNENVNNHMGNANFVNKFHEHMRGGGKPEDFRLTKKKPVVSSIEEISEWLYKNG